MHNLLILFFVIAMLFVYLMQARRSRTSQSHNDPDRFFLSRDHSKEEYGSTQTAYFLQMATVYPFFIFGFTGAWWLGFWNTAFYAIGIAFFYWMLPRFTQGAIDLVGRSSTPHALIANAHRMPALRIFASWLSITAFIGLALFEIVWGATALKAILGGNRYLYSLSIAVLALYLVAVLWTGGQRATIKTAQYQLLIAYIGLHLLTAWAISQAGGSIGIVDAPVLFLFIFIFGSVAIWRRLSRLDQDGSKQLKILNLLAILSLMVVLLTIVFTPDFFTATVYSSPTIKAPSHWGLMLFTLACLPLVFQFVDMTNWQRLSSLTGNKHRVLREAKDGLIFYLIESPLSWLFPIAIGMLAAHFVTPKPGADPWVTLIDQVVALPGGIGGIVSVATVVGVLCIFLSTADELLTAGGYAFAYDVHPKTRHIMDRAHGLTSGDTPTSDDLLQVVQTGKMATSAAIILAVILYIVLDNIEPALGTGLLGFFLTFYSPMLSFAPSILVPALSGRAANHWVSLASMAISASAGIGIGFYSLVSTDEIWQWLGVPVCFVASWAIYLAGLFLGTRKIN